MWRATFGRAISEVTVLLRNTPECHGTWRFLEKNLPTLEQLNPNTNFIVREYPDAAPLEKSFIKLNYGDLNNTEVDIDVHGQTAKAIEDAFKFHVAKGMGLQRATADCNKDRDIPCDIVENFEYEPSFHDFV